MKAVSPLTKCRQARSWKARRIGKDDCPLPVELPFGAAVHATGLSLPPSLPEDQWSQIGDCLCRVHEGVQWALGDWWGFGDQKYGERAAVKRAKAIPYAFGTLMNFGWVARQVEASLRREDLSFSHHAVVACLEPDRQRFWLERAARAKLSVKNLRRRLGETESTGPTADPLALARALYDQIKAEAERALSPWAVASVDWERRDELDALGVGELRQLHETAEQAARAWSHVAEGIRHRLEQRENNEPICEQPDAA